MNSLLDLKSNDRHTLTKTHSQTDKNTKTHTRLTSTPILNLWAIVDRPTEGGRSTIAQEFWMIQTILVIMDSNPSDQLPIINDHYHMRLCDYHNRHISKIALY